jgi:arylsulfatase A-like enzyme
MKRWKRVGALVVLPVVAAGAAAWLLLRPQARPLARMRFAVVAGEPLRYDPGVFHWRSGTEIVRAGQAIADGQAVRFRGRAELRLEPGRRGETVVYFPYAVRPQAAGSVRASIVLERDGRETPLRAFSASRNLERGDAIRLRAEGAGFLVVGRAVVSAPAGGGDRPYVFVLAPDNVRGDRLAPDGGPPSVRAFARDAACFENAVAPTPWTLPSFASLFSGQYEFHHQVTKSSPLAPDKPHLLAGIAARLPVIQFNDDVWLSAKMGLARHHDGFFTSARTQDVYADRMLFANARAFIEAAPFPALFMFLHTYKAHAPYEPGAEFRSRLSRGCRDSMWPPIHGAQFDPRPGEPERREMRALYDAEVEQLDHHIGGFLDWLRAAGLYGRSLIVLTSDHGEEFAEHGGWFHGHSLYRELHHVPLYIKFPGGRFAGRRLRDAVSVVDVLPTVLDQLGIEAPGGIDGVSLLPLLRGERTPGRIVACSAAVSVFEPHIPPRFSLFSGPYHLIVNLPPTQADEGYYPAHGRPADRPAIELFDLRSDPGELRQIAHQQPRVVASLRPEIDRILRTLSQRRRAGRGPDFDEEREALKTLGYL